MSWLKSRTLFKDHHLRCFGGVFVIIAIPLLFQLLYFQFFSDEPIFKTRSYWEEEISKLESDLELVHALFKSDKQELLNIQKAIAHQQTLTNPGARKLVLQGLHEAEEEMDVQLKLDSYLLRQRTSDLANAKAQLGKKGE